MEGCFRNTYLSVAYVFSILLSDGESTLLSLNALNQNSNCHKKRGGGVREGGGGVPPTWKIYGASY